MCVYIYIPSYTGTDVDVALTLPLMLRKQSCDVDVTLIGQRATSTVFQRHISATSIADQRHGEKRADVRPSIHVRLAAGLKK